MARPVAVDSERVPGFKQYLAVGTDENRPEGMISFLAGLNGDINRPPQESFMIVIGERLLGPLSALVMEEGPTGWLIS